MKKIAIIPARLGSSRFPNKPLAPIHGRPMIEHVFKRTALSKHLDDVYVATCDLEIADAVKKAGGKAIITRPDHERGTDRIAEAASQLSLQDNDIVVNVQGDEPMVNPDMIDLALKGAAAHPEWMAVNLVGAIETEEELKDINQIKVITDKNGKALYMSRQPIPSLYGEKKPGKDSHWKQICIIPFRYDALKLFVKLPQTSLEKYESIDMMRFIQNDIAVGTVPYYGAPSQAVDTLADLKKVEKMLLEDHLYKELFK